MKPVAMRKNRLSGLLPVICTLLLLLGQGSGICGTGAPIHFAELRGMVHPLSADYLMEAIDEADRDGAAVLVIEVDTPGGLLDSTKAIAQRMLASKTPIVVYVSPSGARAASAGFLLLIAADVAAMAPGTNTGAAHPVDATGSGDTEDIGSKKVESDVAAFARSIAQNRGRSVEFAEKAVVEAESFTEREALEKGLIDLIAPDREQLLTALDGRKIRRFDGTEVTLSTSGPREAPLERSLAQRFLSPLLNPGLVLLLLGIGMVGVYIELTHPGLILPGVVGVLCILLAALAFQYLPLNAVGLLLIVLAAVLFILEIKVVSYGMLTLGGVACLVTGMMIVFPRDVPGFSVSLWFVLPLALTIAAIMSGILLLVTRAQRARVVTGIEGMIGETGEAVTDISTTGTVAIHGEFWDARSEAPVTRGEEVRVTRVEGMRLMVDKLRRG